MQPMTDAPGNAYTYGTVVDNKFQPVKPLEKLQPGEIVQLNDMWFRRCVATRTHAVRQALLGVLFYLGQQYVEDSWQRNLSIGRLDIPYSKAKGRVRTVDNRIKPIIRSEHARLTQSRPQGAVVPLGDDPEDIQASLAGDDVINHVHREGDVDAYFEDAILWALFGGSSLISAMWDPTKLSPFDEQGDFLFRSLSIFEFGLPRLREPKLEDQPYIQVTKTYDVDEIWERWGVAVHSEKADTQNTLEQELRSALTYTLLGAKFQSVWSAGNKTDMTVQ